MKRTREKRVSRNEKEQKMKEWENRNYEIMKENTKTYEKKRKWRNDDPEQTQREKRENLWNEPEI